MLVSMFINSDKLSPVFSEKKSLWLPTSQWLDLKMDLVVRRLSPRPFLEQIFYPQQKGKPIDFFMLIIEGRIEANVGKEELIFESGSFTYFGLQVLMQLIEEPFTPTTGENN